MLLVERQAGHLEGLPLPMGITSGKEDTHSVINLPVLAQTRSAHLFPINVSIQVDIVPHGGSMPAMRAIHVNFDGCLHLLDLFHRNLLNDLFFELVILVL